MNDLFRIEDINIADCKLTHLERKTNEYINYYLAKINHMFTYKGGSDNFKWWRIEDLCRRAGVGFFAPHKGKVEFLLGSFAGKPDKLYLPTQFVFANVGLNWSDTINVEDGVIFRADHKCIGDLPILERYCELIACCDISIRLATVNSRATTLAIAGSTRDADAINQFYKDLEEGTLTAIVGKNILNGIKTQPYGNGTNSLTDLIEMRQYLISSLENHYALNSNYNMKREAINSNEAQLGRDSLFPYIEDTMECRKEMVNGLNEKFSKYMELGKLEVDFGGIWHDMFVKDVMQVIGTLGGGEPSEEPIEEPTEEPIEEPIEEPVEPIEEVVEEFKEEIIEEVTGNDPDRDNPDVGE